MLVSPFPNDTCMGEKQQWVTFLVWRVNDLDPLKIEVQKMSNWLLSTSLLSVCLSVCVCSSMFIHIPVSTLFQSLSWLYEGCQMEKWYKEECSGQSFYLLLYNLSIQTKYSPSWSACCRELVIVLTGHGEKGIPLSLFFIAFLYYQTCLNLISSILEIHRYKPFFSEEWCLLEERESVLESVMKW